MSLNFTNVYLVIGLAFAICTYIMATAAMVWEEVYSSWVETFGDEYKSYFILAVIGVFCVLFTCWPIWLIVGIYAMYKTN